MECYSAPKKKNEKNYQAVKNHGGAWMQTMKCKGHVPCDSNYVAKLCRQ